VPFLLKINSKIPKLQGMRVGCFITNKIYNYLTWYRGNK